MFGYKGAFIAMTTITVILALTGIIPVSDTFLKTMPAHFWGVPLTTSIHIIWPTILASSLLLSAAALYHYLLRHSQKCSAILSTILMFALLVNILPFQASFYLLLFMPLLLWCLTLWHSQARSSSIITMPIVSILLVITALLHSAFFVVLASILLFLTVLSLLTNDNEYKTPSPLAWGLVVIPGFTVCVLQSLLTGVSPLTFLSMNAHNSHTFSWLALLWPLHNGSTALSLLLLLSWLGAIIIGIGRSMKTNVFNPVLILVLPLFILVNAVWLILNGWQQDWLQTEISQILLLAGFVYLSRWLAQHDLREWVLLLALLAAGQTAAWIGWHQTDNAQKMAIYQDDIKQLMPHLQGHPSIVLRDFWPDYPIYDQQRFSLYKSLLQAGIDVQRSLADANEHVLLTHGIYDEHSSTFLSYNKLLDLPKHRISLWHYQTPGDRW